MSVSFLNSHFEKNGNFSIHIENPFWVFFPGSDEHYDVTEPIIKKVVPVVGLLVQGSPRGVDHVLTYLNDKMPVVILKGSGGVADLLAYAFEELVER